MSDSCVYSLEGDVYLNDGWSTRDAWEAGANDLGEDSSVKITADVDYV
jgi:hypothetical protein